MIEPAQRAEWVRAWPLPLIAMLGLAGSGLFGFSSGVFMTELTGEFGWSRTQFTSAFLASLIVTPLMLPLLGRLIDRVGPRRVALTGIPLAALGIAGLGLANGSIGQWWFLCVLQVMGGVIVTPPVWITAVIGRFDASRGLAIAVALAGTGFGTAVWPILAAWYVELLGWRLAYPALGFTWGAVMLPLTFAFFRGARDVRRDPAEAAAPKAAAPPFAHELRTRTFLFLVIAGGVFICVSYGMVLHFVPILRERGMDLTAAAGLAGITGLCSILGRLGTGVLLDVMPTRLFAPIVFLMPIVVAALLLVPGGSTLPMLLAAVVLGLAMGAESDIVTYIASRRFDPAIFGSVYAIIQTVLAVLSVSGSMVAGVFYDYWGSYELFLYALMPPTLLGAVLITLIPPGKREAPGLPDAIPPGATIMP